MKQSSIRSTVSTKRVESSKGDMMSHEFKVEDVEYVRHGDTGFLARLYRP